VTAPALLGLPIAWLAVFFVLPIAIVAAYSFDVYSLFPRKHGFTLNAWQAFIHSSVYLGLFWKSVKMSLIVSGVVVALAYPVAYYLALSGTKRKYVLLLALIAPFLTSYLLRVLAWKMILADQGGRPQHLPVPDGAAIARPSALAAPLQRVRGHARACIRVGAVRRPADLRCAREPRPASAGGGERPRGKPPAGVPAGDAAALAAGSRRGIPLRVQRFTQMRGAASS